MFEKSTWDNSYSEMTVTVRIAREADMQSVVDMIQVFLSFCSECVFVFGFLLPYVWEKNNLGTFTKSPITYSYTFKLLHFKNLRNYSYSC